MSRQRLFAGGVGVTMVGPYEVAWLARTQDGVMAANRQWRQASGTHYDLRA